MKHQRGRKPVGEQFERLMDNLGIRAEVYEAASKRVLAWQLEQADVVTKQIED